MARRRKNQEADPIELIVKGGLGILIFVTLLTGGLANFVERFVALTLLIVFGAATIAAFLGVIAIVREANRSRSRSKIHPAAPAFEEPVEPPFVWSLWEIQKHLSQIDWYQFEKFCAAILEAEGFEVNRKGGASADGGVDLIVRKNETRTLIQCKHWKTWKIREPVIRQLLGSMVDFEVDKGAVFFSGESTAPAKELAAKHGIGMVDGPALAERALKALPFDCLDWILKCEDHHCPKCDSIMIWRTGNFKPFWGCSRYPKCRGILKQSGAR